MPGAGQHRFLDHHPRYQSQFQLSALVGAADTAQFQQHLPTAGRCRWQVFVANLTTAMTCLMALDFARRPMAGDGRAAMAAGQGWQNSGIRLEASTTYRLQARAGIRWPTSRRFGGASRAGCRSAIIRAARWESCWRPFGPTNR